MPKPIPTYTIKAKLNYFDAPATWRRFKVKQKLPITELAYYLQIMFEMYAAHLYDFTYEFGETKVIMLHDAERYQDFPTLPGMIDVEYLDVEKVLLSDFKVGDTLDFHYDMGDSWEVKLTIEEFDDQTELSAKTLPRIIEGQGFGIVENCGGTMGLEELGKALKHSQDPVADFGDLFPPALYEVSGGFSLDYYNQAELNWRLKRLVRYYRQAYLGEEISQHAIDLMDRDYPEFK